jgi:hypothetical protein
VAGDSLLSKVPPGHRAKLAWVYRGALALALVGCTLTWMQVSYASSFMDQSASFAIGISGTSTSGGMFALIVCLAGIVLSFVNLAALLGRKARLVLASVGLLVVVCSLYVMCGGGFHSPLMSGNFNDFSGNYAKFGASATFGLYMTLVSGAAAALAGLATNWVEHQLSLPAPPDLEAIAYAATDRPPAGRQPSGDHARVSKNKPWIKLMAIGIGALAVVFGIHLLISGSAWANDSDYADMDVPTLGLLIQNKLMPGQGLVPEGMWQTIYPDLRKMQYSRFALELNAENRDYGFLNSLHGECKQAMQALQKKVQPNAEP